MSTNQQFFNDSTPLNKHIVKELGLVRGAVACKIIYASNLRDGVCRMGQKRIADELGIDKSTVSKSIKWLMDKGYLNLLLSASDSHPAHIRPSDRLMKLLGGDDITPPVDKVTPPVDKVTPPVDKVNPPVDKVNQDKNTDKGLNKETINNGSNSSLGKVSLHYEQEIGFISPSIRDHILDAIDDFPEQWVLDAIDVAVGANVRKWNYIRAVLDNWKRDGKQQIKSESTEPTKLRVDPDGGFYV